MIPILAAILAGFLLVMTPLFATTLRLLRAWRREGILSPVGARVAAGHIFISFLAGGMSASMMLSAQPIHGVEALLGITNILVVTFVAGAWTIFYILSETNKNSDDA